MKIYNLKNIKKLRPCVLAIGVFDGAHKGHLKILNETKKIARRSCLASSVLTFHPHPLKILKPKTAPDLIFDLKKRLKLIADSGIEQTIIVNFTKAFSRMPPVDFIKTILAGRLNAKWIVVGKNYRFGRDESGRADLLLKLSREYNFKISLLEPKKIGQHIVSSSLIRKLISCGKVETAEKMLGKPYSLSGRIIQGTHRGKSLGFATANLEPSHTNLLKDGVYAAWALAGGQIKKAMVNIGRRPTFGSKSRTIEIHIFNFSKRLYGQTLEVFFVKTLRSEKKFKNKELLIKQLVKDKKKAENILNKHCFLPR